MTSYEKNKMKLDSASEFINQLVNDLYDMLADTDSYLSDDVEKTANARAAVKEIVSFLLRDANRAQLNLYK